MFSEWFHSIFVPYVTQNLEKANLLKKAILFIDNAAVHNCNFKSENESIKVKFLPPSTIAMIKPMDQGVISSFKWNYKSKLMMELLKATNNSGDAIVALAKCLL